MDEPVKEEKKKKKGTEINWVLFSLKLRPKKKIYMCTCTLVYLQFYDQLLVLKL